MQDVLFLKADTIQNGMTDTSRMDNRDLGNQSRLRFWEIDRFFKCPVPGMCLTNSEQKHLLKKASVSFKKKSLFEIHETLVASSDSENPLSRKVDNLLNRKFNHEAAFLFGLGEKEFKRHLRTCFKAGEFGGALWAAATRPDLSIECRREIFGLVHMAMHSHARKNGKYKKKLACEQEKNSEAENEVREFIDMNTPHQEWMARIFILSSDLSLQKKDYFQARYTLQSLIDYYEVEDDGIKQEAQQKLDYILEMEESIENQGLIESDTLSLSINRYENINSGNEPPTFIMSSNHIIADIG